MSKAKKATVKLYSEHVDRLYSVICPHCHTELVAVADYILVMECWQCRKPIDLRDKNGKQIH
jgi:uncharacterized CHY-type Zn-finger protein